jgi:hypothetical protein
MRRLAGIALLLLVPSLGACPTSAKTTSDGGAAPCTKSGQSCEFSPGKLGVCVEVDAPGGKSSLVCQSQH